MPSARRSGAGGQGALKAPRLGGGTVDLDGGAFGARFNMAVVHETVRSELGAISLQAVYDVLSVLVDVGLVRRIQPAGSPARFEARVSDNHHHVICRNCGRTADVDCAVGSAPCLTAADDNGFEIDEAEVIYWGRCPKCQRRRKK